MAKTIGGAAALALLVGIGALYFYDRMIELKVEQLTDDVYAIEAGTSGNVGVLTTDEGAVVVDTTVFLAQGREVRDLAERLGGGPTRVVINTHYHQDHTHGNPAFPLGTKVVATRRTRDYLFHFDGDYWQGEAESNAPNEVFDDSHELKVGGKTVRVLHLGRGHTGGDLVVLFVEDRVLHTGDLFFNGRYPTVDLEAGGSVREWSATIDRILELDFEHVIPGHGRVTDRKGIVAFQGFIDELWAKASAAVRAEQSLEETLAAVDIQKDDGYDAFYIPLVANVDRDFVVTRAWQEASGAVEAAEVQSAPLAQEGE